MKKLGRQGVNLETRVGFNNIQKLPHPFCTKYKYFWYTKLSIGLCNSRNACGNNWVQLLAPEFCFSSMWEHLMLISSDLFHGDCVFSSLPSDWSVLQTWTHLWVPEVSDTDLSRPPVACSHFLLCCPTSLLITTFKRNHTVQTSQTPSLQFSTWNSLIFSWCNTAHCTDGALRSRRGSIAPAIQGCFVQWLHFFSVIR